MRAPKTFHEWLAGKTLRSPAPVGRRLQHRQRTRSFLSLCLQLVKWKGPFFCAQVCHKERGIEEPKDAIQRG